MTTRCSRPAALATLAACAAMLLAGCGDDTAARALTEAQRANDVAAVQNLMSLHSWYHAAYMNDVELEKLWARKQPDVVWAQNGSYWRGMEAITAYYGAKEKPGATTGRMIMHTVTTGVVEVAQDRKTAKGIWYTPGIVAGYDGAPKPHASWMWERYGVDFINEDGQWKIWHLHVYTDFSIPVGGQPGTDTAPPPGSAPPPPAAGAPAGGKAKAEQVGSEHAPGSAPPVQAGPGAHAAATGTYANAYKEWAGDSVPQLLPRPPEPYKTFAETFSYAD